MSVGLGPFAVETVKKLVAEGAGRNIIDLMAGSQQTEFDFLPEWFEGNSVVLISSEVGDVTLTMGDDFVVPGKDFAHVAIMNIGPGFVTLVSNLLVPEAGRTMTKTGYGIMEVYLIYENPLLVTGGDLKPELPSPE